MCDTFASPNLEITTLSDEVTAKDPKTSLNDLILAPLLLLKLPPRSRFERSRKHAETADLCFKLNALLEFTRSKVYYTMASMSRTDTDAPAFDTGAHMECTEIEH